MKAYTFTPNFSWEDLKTDANGLIPVIVTDYDSGQVLMLAYMDRPAYDRTLKTGLMTYYSRSRQQQWIKGDTSGHYQYVRALMVDCDLDTILAQVKQIGAACHTGSFSCFYRELASRDENNAQSAADPV